MNPLIQLVTMWTQYEQGRKAPDLKGFLTFLNTSLRAPDSRKSATDEAQSHGKLIRIIGRLSSAYGFYHRAAMLPHNLPSADSFYYLNSLQQLGEVRKMELINYLFVENTTGMETIGKLADAGLVSETDPSDRRARLLSISRKGQKVLSACLADASRVNAMIFSGLGSTEVDTCIALLENLEKYHSQSTMDLKGMSFEDMCRRVLKV